MRLQGCVSVSGYLRPRSGGRATRSPFSHTARFSLKGQRAPTQRPFSIDAGDAQGNGFQQERFSAVLVLFDFYRLFYF